MVKDFEPNALVWAKMKGYPPWPGKIMAPPSNAKPKKNHHYVFFFGSDNHAWIPDDCIELHNDKLIEKYGKRKGSLFQSAVETITKSSKGKKRGNDNTPTAKEPVDKVKSDVKTDKPTSDSTSIPKKIKKSIPKPPSKTPVQQKKPVKRNVPSPNESEPETSSAKKGKTEDTEDTGDTEDTEDTEADSRQPGAPSPIGIPDLLIKQIFHKEVELPEKKPEKPSLKREYIECPKPLAVNMKYCSEFLKKKKIVANKIKIGFLGLGLIGVRIVKNLCLSGHKRIVVWNDTPEECKMVADHLEVKIANSPARVIQDSHVIFCCVSDSELAKELILGDYGLLNEIERSASENKGYIQMTSMDPSLSRDIGTEIRMKGGRFLEAPFTGSRSDADEGTLLVTAAGDKALYDECKSCFDAMSKKHMFVSAEVGTAMKLTIAHNMFIGTAYAAVAESLALAVRSGIRAEDFYEIIQVTDLNCPSLLKKVHSMIKRDYTTDIPLKQMQHDLGLGLSLGHEISQCSEALATANQVYKHCTSIDYGDHDVSAVYEGTKP